MRILFLNRNFPGPFRSLVRSFADGTDNIVLFLAEKGQKNGIPGVRRLRIAPPLNHTSEDGAEQEGVIRLRRAARAGNAMLGLKKDGFVPELVCTTSSMPGNFFVRDIFPEAFYLVQADWFYHARNLSVSSDGRGHSPVEFAPARVRNLWEYNSIGDADLAVATSTWQREQYPPFLAERMKVVPSGVDTDFFSPRLGKGIAWTGLDLAGATEIVSFSGSPQDHTRGFSAFVRSIPQFLSQRPRCHVVVAWPVPAPLGHDSARQWQVKLAQCKDELALSADVERRVHLVGPCTIAEYRRMLHISTVHVYFTAPTALSTGILEAMACGVLVVGSDTAPVREVLEHGVNGFLCDASSIGNIAETVSGLLERAPRMGGIREQAVASVRKKHNALVQTQCLKDLILSSMRESRPAC